MRARSEAIASGAHCLSPSAIASARTFGLPVRMVRAYGPPIIGNIAVWDECGRPFAAQAAGGFPCRTEPKRSSPK